MAQPKEEAFIQTHLGKKIAPYALDPEQIYIEDIAHSLSNLCRFNGHTKVFYSVAQHSVHVAQLCFEKINNHRMAYMALLHDMPEYTLGDNPRPLKKQMPEYVVLEEEVAKVMYKHFGITTEEQAMFQDVIKYFDNVALITEATQLLACPPILDWTAHYPVEPDPNPITPLHPEDAKSLFLMKFSQYKAY